MFFTISRIRQDFPILSHTIDGHALVYLDGAATAQVPSFVLERMEKFYREEKGNVHRGMHVLAERATVAYEEARKTVMTFIGASRPEEVIFTRGTTESINLVARSWGQSLNEGDAVVVSLLEHHSNIVPWLQLKEERGIEIRWIDIDDQGRLRTDMLEDFLKDGRVKLLSITAQSNVLGVRPPLQKMIATAHDHGALVLVDAAQSIAHHPTDVRELDCDFLAFSGHKLYGPTGIGVLYGRKNLLQTMPPFLGGGMMIEQVRQDRFTPADIPARFEAGTPPIAEAVGLAAAIRWITQFSWKDIEAHEKLLLSAALAELGSIPGLRILGPGTADEISGCISFVIEGIHPHDLTDILGKQGICLRAGHHCAQPLHKRLGIPASTRLSVGLHTNATDVIAVSAAIKEALSLLRG